MLKKIALGVLGVVLVAGVGLFVWARSVLTQDNVRTALAARLTDALGQPVAIGGISAGIFPRVTVKLTGVTIGPQANLNVSSLDIGTNLRALLSKRIEHGRMELKGARIQLPLPPLAFASSGPSGPAPVEIVSIDEIVLSGVDIISSGHTLHGDIELVPEGNGVIVRKMALKADDAAVNVTGRIADLSGPVGELTLNAGALDINRLLAFASAFSNNTGVASSSPRPAGQAGGSSVAPAAMHIALTMAAERATMGTLVLDKLSGRATVTPAALTLDPAAFNVFGGHYAGAMTLSLAENPEFRLKATLANVDMTAATAYAGTPGMITGRLAGKVDVSGKGTTADAVTRSARGTVRFDITDGVVKNLGLIQAVVVATSMRSGATSANTSSRDEPFSRLGATISVANGSAATDDLRLESKDLTLNAAGSFRLDGSAIDLKGRVQLSDALTQQAGRDLVRYTQDQGRVTLPVTVSGSAANPQVRIDVGDVMQRAVKNAAADQAKKAIGKGLGSLLGKP